MSLPGIYFCCAYSVQTNSHSLPIPVRFSADCLFVNASVHVFHKTGDRIRTSCHNDVSSYRISSGDIQSENGLVVLPWLRLLKSNGSFLVQWLYVRQCWKLCVPGMALVWSATGKLARDFRSGFNLRGHLFEFFHTSLHIWFPMDHYARSNRCILENQICI